MDNLCFNVIDTHGDMNRWFTSSVGEKPSFVPLSHFDAKEQKFLERNNHTSPCTVTGVSYIVCFSQSHHSTISWGLGLWNSLQFRGSPFTKFTSNVIERISGCNRPPRTYQIPIAFPAKQKLCATYWSAISVLTPTWGCESTKRLSAITFLFLIPAVAAAPYRILIWKPSFSFHITSMVIQCASPGCDNPVTGNLACPNCKKLGIDNYFCTQDCFKKNYATHKQVHAIAKKVMAAKRYVIDP